MHTYLDWIIYYCITALQWPALNTVQYSTVCVGLPFCLISKQPHDNFMTPRLRKVVNFFLISLVEIYLTDRQTLFSQMCKIRPIFLLTLVASAYVVPFGMQQCWHPYFHSKWIHVQKEHHDGSILATTVGKNVHLGTK